MTRQYFHRVDGCPAPTITDEACICWHDEGTGPFPNVKEYDDYPGTRIDVNWREKPEDKITLEELMDLFGGQLPIEAAAIVFSSPPDKTVGEVRAEITAMAKAAARYTIEVNRSAPGWVQITISGPRAHTMDLARVEDLLNGGKP